VDQEKSISSKEEESKISLEEEEEKKVETETSSVECPKKEKCQRKKRCFRLCACFGILMSVCMVFWSILVITLSVKAYSNFNDCFDSDNFKLNEVIYKDKNIQNVHLNVITGIVSVDFHDQQDFIVRVYDRTRQNSPVDVNAFNSSIMKVRNMIYIVSEAPAFDFHHCQHSNIEILIPKTYAQKVSFSGFIKTGSLSFFSENIANVGIIDLTVEAGFISVEQINAQSISLSTELGVIELAETVATQSIKLLVNTGSIRTYDIITKDLQSVVKYGRTLHYDVVSEKIYVETKWGYSRIFEASSFTSMQDIKMKTEYGRTALMLNSPNINFSLGSRKGDMIVEYENEMWKCAVSSKNVTMLNGKCNSLENKKESNKVNVNLNTKYGVSYLLVDSIDD
jgi:hypothetical protein